MEYEELRPHPWCSSSRLPHALGSPWSRNRGSSGWEGTDPAIHPLEYEQAAQVFLPAARQQPPSPVSNRGRVRGHARRSRLREALGESETFPRYWGPRGCSRGARDRRSPDFRACEARTPSVCARGGRRAGGCRCPARRSRCGSPRRSWSLLLHPCCPRGDLRADRAASSRRSLAALGIRPDPLGIRPDPLGIRPDPLGTRRDPLGTRPSRLVSAATRSVSARTRLVPECPSPAPVARSISATRCVRTRRGPPWTERASFALEGGDVTKAGARCPSSSFSVAAARGLGRGRRTSAARGP